MCDAQAGRKKSDETHPHESTSATTSRVRALFFSRHRSRGSLHGGLGPEPYARNRLVGCLRACAWSRNSTTLHTMVVVAVCLRVDPPKIPILAFARISRFWAVLARIASYRGGWKIIIGSKGLFCDLESTRRVCLCTLYPKPNPSKAISCVLSPKMNSPAHQTCDFMVNFGAENGHFWHISLLWHVAQIRGSMLKKIAQIRDTRANQVRYWSV